MLVDVEFFNIFGKSHDMIYAISRPRSQWSLIDGDAHSVYRVQEVVLNHLLMWGTAGLKAQNRKVNASRRLKRCRYDWR